MNAINIETVQWSALKDIDDVEPINEKDHYVLTELREVLLKHGYTNRLGICLLHKHFDISQNEIVVEKTDVDARVSVLSVEKNNNEQNSIETMWKFSDNIEAGQKCVLRCNYNSGHRSYHSTEAT